METSGFSVQKSSLQTKTTEKRLVEKSLNTSLYIQEFSESNIVAYTTQAKSNASS